MKILIELPDNWLDSDLTGNLDWMVKTVRSEVKDQLIKAIVEQVEMPKLDIDQGELKRLVLDKLATRMVEDRA